MFSRETKKLLKNVILHTSSHNKILEEEEMWKQHGLHTSTKTSSTYPMVKRAHMDQEEPAPSSTRSRSPSGSKSSPRSRSPGSTYWMKQLQKFEESDQTRWGHGGYKEMYPEQFTSDEDKKTKHHHKKKKMKKKHHKKKRKQSKEREGKSESQTVTRTKADKHSLNSTIDCNLENTCKRKITKLDTLFTKPHKKSKSERRIEPANSSSDSSSHKHKKRRKKHRMKESNKKDTELVWVEKCTESFR